MIYRLVSLRALRSRVAPAWLLLLFTVVIAADPASAAAAEGLPESAEIDRALAREFRTVAARPVNNHRGPLMRELEPLLMQQARYLVSRLESWPQDPSTLRFPESTHSGEHSIRPNAHTALGLAILVGLVPDEAFTPTLPRETVRENALGLLRFLLLTHGAAGLVCDDGKAWRAQWQSALWAAMAGEACWLLWDDLSPREKWLAARMISDEADRFVGKIPPAQVRRDTKAEENAWNSMVISLACTMFPEHPRQSLWQETAIRWTLSSFVRQEDVASSAISDGKPLSEWVASPNIHSDYTLENHHRVHPDYMTTTTMLSYQIPLYSWAGIHPPMSLHFNVENICASQKRLALPDGGWVYPSAQDWHLRRVVDWLPYHAAMSTLYRDREAAALTRICLSTMQRMAARNPDGSIMLPSESKFASSQSMVLEWPAQAYLLMAQFGEGPSPLPSEELWEKVSGRHLFEHGEFGLLRTNRSVATFSWGSQVMGIVLPLREDQLLTPNPRGLIGVVEMPGSTREAPEVQEVRVADFPDALGLAGVLSRGGGALEQRFGFLALPDGRTIYIDLVQLTGADKPAKLDLGTIGVLNDKNWPWHDATRTLSHEGGTMTFAAADAETDEPLALSSRWYNLDGMGIVCADASGQQVFQPKPTGAVGRLEQLFHLNAVAAETLAEANPADPIAHVALIFYPEQTIEETRSAARHCTVERTEEARVRITLEDGLSIRFDLRDLTVAVVAPGAADLR